MDWKKRINQQLVAAVLSLREADEVQRFLRDLLTEGEIDEFAKRLEAAEMLSRNVPYSQIQGATGFSTTTIARVSKWLKSGTGGYPLVITRLHHAHPSRGRGLR